MTPEQRETLEGMADYAERFARMSAEHGDPNGAAWHASRAAALRAALVEPPAETCAWSQDEDDRPNWSSACGREWQFFEDGPTENRVNYCIGCGRKVVVTRTTPKE